LIALHLDLDFACCICGKAMGVTLRCDGVGLMADKPVAAVKVPCPTCGECNQLYFSPDGTLHGVERERIRYRLPEPCPN
jgi:hypothetical protein